MYYYGFRFKKGQRCQRWVRDGSEMTNDVFCRFIAHIALRWRLSASDPSPSAWRSSRNSSLFPAVTAPPSEFSPGQGANKFRAEHERPKFLKHHKSGHAMPTQLRMDSGTSPCRRPALRWRLQMDHRTARQSRHRRRHFVGHWGHWGHISIFDN
jgi:hypothetical protein